MLPESALSGMSAEDFRLILCGCAHIDIDVLRSITIFDDESREFVSQLKVDWDCRISVRDFVSNFGENLRWKLSLVYTLLLRQSAYKAVAASPV